MEMSLYLLEFGTSAAEREELRPLFDEVADLVQKSGGEVIEAQVGTDLKRAYVVVEHPDQERLRAALRDCRTPVSDIAPVRLVGTTLEALKAARGNANYLVEWDLPKELTMEAYLERKRANSPNYAKVPEVRFLRTYVREDMMKCLCLYDAPSEEAVRRAREAVCAPIDRLTRLAGPSDGQS